MSYTVRIAAALSITALVLLIIGGCPLGGGTTAGQVIEGSAGQTSQISGNASVEVLTPPTNLSITGGTQVEVNWRAFATTRFAVLDVFLDLDQDPDNNNEIIAFSNLNLEQSSALIDTTRLAQGTYFIGVRLEEIGTIVAFDYAPGSITIDQRPTVTFLAPSSNAFFGARDNVAFDRSERITVPFEIVWEISDPDSNNTVTAYLDPDELPDGDEILLYESASQTGDSFRFDLPTAAFEAGTYQILLLVSDGVNVLPFYAPGRIQLRARLAGFIDLRDLHLPETPVRGAVFEGFNPRDNAGSFVSSLRDIDGDGFNDFIILAQFGKPRYDYSSQRTGIGEAYVIYGRPDPFSGVINLNSTGTLFRGDIITGPPETPDPVRPSRGITSFTMLSDWDNDGVPELCFGVPFTDSVALSAFLLGGATAGAAPLDPSGYFRTGAVVIAAGSTFRPDLGFPGRNVRNLAEFGTLAHMPLNAPVDCPEGFEGPKAPAPFGGVTLFHEHLVGAAGEPSVGGITLGCRFSSIEFGDQFGETVSSYDFDSVIISAPNRDPIYATATADESVPGSGVVSVYFNDVKDGFYPWTNNGAPPANDNFNYAGSTQSAGDRTLPHGGPYHYIIDDIRIANSATGIVEYTPGYYVDPDDAEDPCEEVIDSRMARFDHTVRFWSNQAGARLSNVKGIGDINADGLVDMLIGAPFINQGSGACYIVLGRLRDLVMSGELQIEELDLPMNSSDPDMQRIFDGVRIVGAPNERLGQSQDNAGDFNNDGLADIVIGSPFLNERAGGAVVFFGNRNVINLTENEIPFEEIADRGLGVVFTGEAPGDLAGARVTSAGDVDGDGNTDILIAAPDRSVQLDIDLDGTIEIDRTGCGVVYLVYGSPDLAVRTGSSGRRGVFSLADIGKDRRQGGISGTVFIGRRSGDHLGAGLGLQGDRSVGIAPAGDVDGDGIGDLLLSSVSASPRDRAAAGEVYLVYGIGN